MNGLDIVLACLLGALSCKVDVMGPPAEIKAPQIVNVCPVDMAKTGKILHSRLLTDANGKQILVILSCPKDV